MNKGADRNETIKPITKSKKEELRKIWRWILLAFAIVLIFTWLLLTPKGLLGKADAVGYSVCHQIDVRSFHINGRPFPLCARCSGMFLGALLGLIYQTVQGRKGKMPPLETSIIFGVLAFSWAFDGVNSFLMMTPIIQPFYSTQNLTRLVTGTGMGLAVSAILRPAFIQTVYDRWEDRSPFESWKQVVGILFCGAVLVLLILFKIPWVLYLFALLSAGSIFTMLTLVYTTALVMIIKRENTYGKFKELLFPLIGGFSLALLQIGTIDLARFLLTGTWGGFKL